MLKSVSHQRIIKGTGGFGNKRTSRDHPNYYIIENGQNAAKSPGKPEETGGHTDSSERPLANAGVKNSQRIK